jgi:hypothetical protein
LALNEEIEAAAEQADVEGTFRLNSHALDATFANDGAIFTRDVFDRHTAAANAHDLIERKPGQDSLGGQTPEEVARQFVGTWRLVSWEHRLADGTTVQDPRSVGYLIHSDTGHGCYVSMDPNRPDWATRRSPTPTEALESITGFGAYCAKVEIHASEGFVLHHVEVDRVPNSVGITRKRWFEFRGVDELVLSLEPSELPPHRVGTNLVWKRVRE